MAQGVATELQEQLALTRKFLQALEGCNHRSLRPLVAGVGRADPAKGIRGSELLVWAANAAAASRLKMFEHDLLALARGLGSGIQCVRIRVATTNTRDDGRRVALGPGLPARPERSASTLAAIQALRQKRSAT